MIAAHHEAPLPGEFSLSNFLRVGWRMADTLGYAAFSPDRLWEFEELIEFIPNAASSWLGVSSEIAKAALATSLSGLPS